MKVISSIEITPEIIGNLSEYYRRNIGDYPKFFKMDGLCKTGFIASEILLQSLPADIKSDIAIVLFNRSGSLVTDRKYQQTITSEENYFPSPAIFVYTLANIVTGEIAIRHKIMGESSFYIMSENDTGLQNDIAMECYLTSNPSMVLTGWVEYENDEDFYAHLRLLSK